MTKTASCRAGARRALFLLGAAGLAASLPSVAFAQDDEVTPDEPAPPADEAAATGNEILVTATKREQTLQDTPVAVTVATQEQIERAQIRDLKDLSTLVPSLRVTQLQSSANTNFIIRGFGNGANNAGIEPSVGVFIDGVYRSRTASQINDLPNISRVEILRGPQSTLFGKNASAGVISVRTEEPQFDLGGNVEASYGNYNAIVARGYVTGPLSDTVAASIAGGYSSRDGYIKDLGTGDRTNERDRWFARGQVLFEPSTDLKVRIIGDYSAIDENCCGVVNLFRSPATAVIDALGNISDANDPFADITYSNLNSTNDIKDWGVSGEINYTAGPIGITSITAFRNNHSVTAQDPDFSSADLINPLAADVDIDTFTQELRLTADFGDFAHFLLGGFYIKENVDSTGSLLWGSQARPYADQLIQSLSGGTQNLASLEGTLGTLEGNPAKYAGKFFATGTGNQSENYGLDSEAFSIFGQADFDITDGLTLTLGGNYTKDTKDYSAAINGDDVFSQVDLVADGNTAIRIATLQNLFAFSGLNPLSPADVATFIGTYGQNAYDTIVGTATAVAAYNDELDPADAATDPNPLNVGGNPLLPLQPLQYLPQFLPVPNSVEDGHISDDAFTYTIRLAYEVNDQVNVYASYATGFKAASVNLSRDSRPLLADAAALQSAGLTKVNQSYGTRFADPEHSRVIEFGVKTNFDRVSANLAIFDQQIKGFQSNIFTGTGFALSNAGKQSTFGVEFESQAELFKGFTANLGVTYLHPKYDDYVFSSVGDLSGTRPGGIPTWTVVVGGTYDYEMDNGDDIILSASYHYESDVKITEGLPYYFQELGQAAGIAAADPYHRQVDDLTASLTYAMDNGLEFTVWGRNLLNDRYILQIFDSVAQPYSISGYANQPRTWGGTVRFKF